VGKKHRWFQTHSKKLWLILNSFMVTITNVVFNHSVSKMCEYSNLVVHIISSLCIFVFFVCIHICPLEEQTSTNINTSKCSVLKYSDTQNITLTTDKEVNIWIHISPLWVIIYGSYKLLKTVQFLAHVASCISTVQLKLHQQ